MSLPAPPPSPVAHVLTKWLDGRVTGSVTLPEPEPADLKAGKCLDGGSDRLVE